MNTIIWEIGGAVISCQYFVVNTYSENSEKSVGNMLNSPFRDQASILECVPIMSSFSVVLF